MADSGSRAGQVHVDAGILEYVDRLHATHDESLTLAFDSPEQRGIPAIQVSKQEGALLELLVRLSGATRIVEVGTLAAYSTIRLARAMESGGKVWTIEFDKTHAEIAEENLRKASLGDSAEVIVGSGREILPTLEGAGPFDLVFIDADKESYDFYGRWAAANIRKGGLLVGDNAFLFGNLLDSSEEASAMRRFHEESRENFETLCLPTPDGVLIGIRR